MKYLSVYCYTYISDLVAHRPSFMEGLTESPKFSKKGQTGKLKFQIVHVAKVIMPIIIIHQMKIRRSSKSKFRHLLKQENGPVVFQLHKLKKTQLMMCLLKRMKRRGLQSKIL